MHTKLAKLLTRSQGGDGASKLVTWEVIFQNTYSSIKERTFLW